MNRKNIIKIINKELTILKDVAEGFADDTEIHPIEIDLALSKTTDIYNMFSLLKDKNSLSELQTIPQEPKNTTQTIETKKEVIEKKPIEIIEDKIEKEIEEPIEIEKEETPTQEIIEAEESANDSEPQIEAPEQINTPDTLPEEKEEEFIDELYEDEIIEKTEKHITAPKPKTKKKVAEHKDEQMNNILADQFQEHTISINDMLSSFKKDKNLAALLKDRPVTNLKKAVKINDRIWYIKELFENNADNYSATIEKLNQLKDLDEALSYVFSEFTWDQNKKSTISFLELIYRRFAQIN